MGHNTTLQLFTFLWLIGRGLFYNYKQNRYNLIYYIEAYEKLHPICSYDASSDGDRSITYG